MTKIKVVIAALLLVSLLQAQHENCDSHAEHREEVKTEKHDEHADCDGDDHEKEKHDEHADCDGDDHEKEKHDEHADCDGDDHEKEKKDDHSSCDGDDHDEEGEEGHIELTAAIAKRVGITIEQVEHAPVTSVITVPGEIQFNDDRLAHVIPSYPSKAVSVKVRQGEWVKKGTILATLTNRETLSRYSVTAPISGRVVTKHLTSGEVVDDSDTLFTIANLSTVWAEFAVPQDRLDGIQRNSEMMISLVSHEEESVTAKVNYISPVTDPLTRRVTVRATVNNQNNHFRPGSYVTARINYGDPASVVAVENDAVQRIGGENVVFVPVDGEEYAYKAAHVITGRSNSRYTEIVSGISEGADYVTHGAFVLKAQMVTADMDPHAGHNH